MHSIGHVYVTFRYTIVSVLQVMYVTLHYLTVSCSIRASGHVHVYINISIPDSFMYTHVYDISIPDSFMYTYVYDSSLPDSFMYTYVYDISIPDSFMYMYLL